MSVGFNSGLPGFFFPTGDQSNTNPDQQALNTLLSIFGMGTGNYSTYSGSTQKEIPDYLSGIGMSATDHLALHDDDSGDDAFWDYIDAKAASANGQTSDSTGSSTNQLLGLLMQLLGLNQDNEDN